MPFPCPEFPGAAVPRVLSVAVWQWHQSKPGSLACPASHPLGLPPAAFSQDMQMK